MGEMSALLYSDYDSGFPCLVYAVMLSSDLTEAGL